MKSEDFDRALNGVLAKCAAAEPRAGLEQRVLANLHVELSRATANGWPRWAAATAVVAIVVLLAVCHSGNAVRRGPVAARDLKIPIGSYAVQPGEGNLRFEISNLKEQYGERHAERSAAAAGVAAKRPLARQVALSEAAVASESGPRLEQFPAPSPLSEQERLLMQYVQDDPENAGLLAETVTLAEQWGVEQAKVADRGDTGPH